MLWKGYKKKYNQVLFRHFECQYKRKEKRKTTLAEYIHTWKLKDTKAKLHRYLKQKGIEADPKIVRKYLEKLDLLQKEKP